MKKMVLAALAAVVWSGAAWGKWEAMEEGEAGVTPYAHFPAQILTDREWVPAHERYMMVPSLYCDLSLFTMLFLKDDVLVRQEAEVPYQARIDGVIVDRGAFELVEPQAMGTSSGRLWQAMVRGGMLASVSAIIGDDVFVWYFSMEGLADAYAEACLPG